MAKATKNQKAVAPEVTAETTTEQATEVTTEATAESTEQVADDAAETTAEEVVAEKAKRERSYSQSAVNTDDLARMTSLKAHIKETRKINVSNQTILAAALDCLAQEANMEAFLKSLVTTAADRQRVKDLKAFETLKAKLEGTEPAAETEATPEA